MDRIEAQLIIDILKTGSRYYRPLDREFSSEDEGFFIWYRPESDDFVVRRYETDDWAVHRPGCDEEMVVSEAELMRLFTEYGKDVTLWPLYDTNRYRFDFDTPQPRKTIGQAIRESMHASDLGSLRCSHCASRDVEPTEYSSDVNPARARRYVHLAVECTRCGKTSVYEWDD